MFLTTAARKPIKWRMCSSQFAMCNLLLSAPRSPSKLRISRRPCEGDHIANVRHAGQEHDQTFESEAESRVRHGSVSAQVHIPPIILGRELVELHVVEQLLEPFLALRAADHF